MDRNDAIRKVAALLRLAARPGTTGEAAAAAGKAEEMMARYEITRAAALDAEPTREPDEEIADYYERPEGWLEAGRRVVTWRWVLASRVSRLHGCYVFTAHRGAGRSIEIVGRPGQVEAVRYLYAYLTRAVDHITDVHGRGMGATWRNNFALGAVGEIARRLAEERASAVTVLKREHAASPGALVRIEQASTALARQHVEADTYATAKHKLRSGGGVRSSFNPDARSAGASAARSISLGGARGSLGGAARQIGGRS